jgi:hypothetical protein
VGKELLFSFLLGFGVPLLAAAPAIAQTQSANPVAYDIARVLLADEIIYIQVQGAMATSTQKAFEADPVLAELKSAYPGIEQAFYDVILPITVDEMKRAVPQYSEELAIFFSGAFNEAELRQLLQFWTSPAAQNMLRNASKRMNFDATAAEVARQIGNEDLTISDAAIREDVQKGVDEALGEMSRADLAAFTRFALTPVGKKFSRLAPEKQVIDMKWANNPLSSEAKARIDRELPAAMSAFMAAADEKKSQQRAQ